MRLYLDDDSVARKLAAVLRHAAHDVIIPAGVKMSGKSDASHLEYAIQHSLVLLTRNHKDFVELNNLVLTSGGSHPGILVVRYDNDPTRDMKPRAIAAATARLLKAGVPLANQIYVLNHWR